MAQISQSVHQISPCFLERKLPGLLTMLAVTTSWHKCTSATTLTASPAWPPARRSGRLDSGLVLLPLRALTMGCGAWCSGLIFRTDGGRRAEHACERQVGITPGQESSLERVTHSRTGWPLQAGGPGPLCGGLPCGFLN